MTRIDDLQAATRLVRAGRGGATIHLSGCSRIGAKSWPWVWAEGRDDDEWLSKPWLKPCKACLPVQRARQDQALALRAALAALNREPA